MPCLVDGCIQMHHPLLHDAAAERHRTAKQVKKEKPVLCFVCRSKRHDASLACSKFSAMSVPQRWDALNGFKEEEGQDCCARCLKIGHAVQTCNVSTPCGKDGCREDHHQILHDETRHGSGRRVKGTGTDDLR